MKQEVTGFTKAIAKKSRHLSSLDAVGFLMSLHEAEAREDTIIREDIVVTHAGAAGERFKKIKPAVLSNLARFTFRDD